MILRLSKLSLLIAIIASLSVMAAPVTVEPESSQSGTSNSVGTWNVHVVDTAGEVGVFNSLVIDAQGYPHISYFDVSNTDLKYATWTGNIWKIETVDSTGYVGTDTSIALDSKGYPHISYRGYISATNSEVLKHAWWTGSGWNIEVVDSAYRTAFSTSIAVDSQDRVHISYYEGWSAYRIRYALWDGSVWNLEPIDWYGGAATQTSLVLDSNDYPHIAYYDGFPDYRIRHAWWTGSNWMNESLSNSRYVCSFVSLVLDKNDIPYMVFQNIIYNSINFASRSGGVWNTELVDYAGDACTHTALELDSQDTAHVAYSETGNHTLRYAKRVGGNWVNETVDSSGIITSHISLAMDSNDLPHVSYYDEAGFELKYATRVELPPPLNPVLSASPSVLDFATLPPNMVDSKTFEVWNSGGEILNYSINESISWITSVNPSGGSSTGEHDIITVTIDTTGLSQGLHQGFILIDSNGGNGTIDVQVNVTAPSRHISLDIDPNTLNLKSRGRWITAYLTVENASPEDIDTSSLLLNDIVPPSRWDVQSNTTLMVKFDRAAVQAIVTVSDSMDIKVTGLWKDGVSFEVHDTIRVIDPGK